MRRAVAPLVAVRPMSAGDAPALVRFHERLSDDTPRLRFFTQHRHLSQREVQRFTHVDHHDREALVAWSQAEIVGVGRYDRTEDPELAEAAFVVADGWQGHGDPPARQGQRPLLRVGEPD